MRIFGSTTLFFFLFFSSVTRAQSAAVRMSPVMVRQSAIESPLPIYPKSSVDDAHHGVAVVDFTVDSVGKATDLKILQSPDDAISEAVTAAMKAWRFHPFMVGGRATPVKSRFIFYFDLDANGPHVTDATRSSF